MNISTKGRITIMLGKHQHHTGQRLSPRRLAQIANVPKDLVYRLDAGTARYIDLRALARLCTVLNCRVEDILLWDGHTEQAKNARHSHNDYGDESI